MYRHLIQNLQARLNSTKEPGLNGTCPYLSIVLYTAFCFIIEAQSNFSYETSGHFGFWIDTRHHRRRRCRARQCVLELVKCKCQELTCGNIWTWYVLPSFYPLYSITTCVTVCHYTFTDHGDEWCIREPTENVIFCFDKHAGYGGYGDPSWGYGVRNLVFSSTEPKGGVQTWIRLEEGEIRANVTLDESYS